MDKLTLQNFRSFKDRVDLDIKPITILTGKNNSGKSSVIKALLLYSDYILGNDQFMLPFYGMHAHKHKINQFGNAHHWKSDPKFTIGYENQGFELEFNFENLTQNEGRLVSFTLKHIITGVQIVLIHKKDMLYDLSFSDKILDFIQDLRKREKLEARKKSLEKLLNSKPINLQKGQENNGRNINELKISIQQIAIELQSLTDQTQINNQIETEHLEINLDDIQRNSKKLYEILSTNITFKKNKLLNDFLEKYKIETQILKINNESIPYNLKDNKEFIAPLSSENIPNAIPLSLPSKINNTIPPSLTDINQKATIPPIPGKSSLPVYERNKIVHNKWTTTQMAELSSLLNKSNSSGLNSETEMIFFLRNLLSLSISHLSPNRTRHERIYVNKHSQTEIEDVIAEYARYTNLNNNPGEAFLNKWLLEFEIGTSIQVESVEGVASRVRIKKADGSQSDLVDMGFGSGQILTLLLQIANLINQQQRSTGKAKPIRSQNSNELLIIEEPEANLHPKLQSKLADLFTTIWDQFRIKTVIETHSEYLIRKFQLKIAREDEGLTTNDVVIYYIDQNQSEQRIRKIAIQENGALSDVFGDGFFDEAVNHSLELYKIQKKKA